MIEKKGSIWDEKYNDAWRVIPINLELDRNDDLIMGKGLAKDAAKLCPIVKVVWGYDVMIWDTPRFDTFGRIFQFQNYSIKLIGFPTKFRWQEKSSLPLIEKCLIELKRRIICKDFEGRIILPRLGCGEDTGQLQWSEVEPLVEKYLDGLDVLIVSQLEKKC